MQELKQIVKDKEENLRQCEHLHNKQVTELSNANEDLQQRFDKVIMIYHICSAGIHFEYSAGALNCGHWRSGV